jgi:hypothetical protein
MIQASNVIRLINMAKTINANVERLATKEEMLYALRNNKLKVNELALA